MALHGQAVVAGSRPPRGVARVRRGIAAFARTLWGLTAGLLFLLAFPLAIVLAPALWAFARLRNAAGGGFR
jgi:hypothetical protein